MSKNKKRCHECMYRGDGYDLVGCDYATITGHVRGAIAPEECTHFQKGDRMRRAEYLLLKDMLSENRRRAPCAGKEEKHDWSIAEQLYKEGKNDGEISREMGVRPQLVCAWRKRNGLQPNTTEGGRRKKLDWDKVKELYDQGKYDSEIAKVFGVSDNVIFKWRKRNNLPAIKPKGRSVKYDWDTVKKLYEAGMLDMQIEEQTGISRKRICAWRSQNHLPKNPEPVNGDAEEFSKRAQELYDKGLNDKEIAKELGVGDSRVFRWRKKQNLEANVIGGGRRKKRDET